MKPPLFRYEAPRSLRDAVAVLESDPDAMVLAGGQSLVPAMNFRVAAPSLLVDIQHVEGLKGIAIDGNKIVIKAMTRHRELELDARVRQLNPLIAETMQHVAHVPIRNRGTVVGSLCHADPSAEMPMLFVLLDGTITAEGSDGRREIAAADFFQSFLTTSRRQDEIVIEARLPVLPDGAGFAFDEVTRRHGDYALVGLGCVLSLDDTGRVQDIRLAACGISDRPVRLKPAEDALKGKLVNSNELVAAAHASLDAVTQADDMNTSMSYRRRVLSGLIQRLVPIAAARARRGYRQ
jgi:CO/xanthine dehydrogenase FAD-binding subunit